MVVMLGLDPGISQRKRLLRVILPRFSGLRFASPENDDLPQNKTAPAFTGAVSFQPVGRSAV
jgi:hypothetical protein